MEEGKRGGPEERGKELVEERRCGGEEWRRGGEEEWGRGGVEDWRSGVVEEWRRGGVEERRSGGVEERRRGGETKDFNSNFTVKTLYANSVGCLKEEGLCVTPVSQSNYFPR